MRKFNKKAFKRKLHQLWSLYIRTRDDWTCQWCGEQKERWQLDAHHIIPKGRAGNQGRYEIENGITLCSRCHLWESGSRYIEFARWIENWLNERGLNYDELNDKYKGALVKDNQEWFATKYKVLSEMYTELLKQKEIEL